MRFLLITNGQFAPPPAGLPRALDALRVAGAIDAWSMLTPEEDPRGIRPALDELPEVARAFAPDAVVFLKPEGWGLGDGDVRALRAAIGPSALIGLANFDAWSRFRRPPGPESRALVPATDVVWTSGAGSFPALFRRLGARRVRYQWLGIDGERFSVPVQRPSVPDYDVVFIGNLIRSPRLCGAPTPRLPGLVGRMRLVRNLERRFGRRLAVFGVGWKGRCALGPLPWVDQHRALGLARVAANWDHFPREPYYFSGRTPISMASGTPFVTTWHPGYEAVFEGGNGLTWGRTVEEVVARVEDLLESDDAGLRRVGDRARSFALERFTLERKYARIVADLQALKDGRPLVGLGLPDQIAEAA